MSPESYVLLLIGCWLLLASSTLWGILRITRRHYLALELDHSDAPTDATPQPTEQHEPAYVGLRLFGLRLKAVLATARLPSIRGPLLTLHRRITAD